MLDKLPDDCLYIILNFLFNKDYLKIALLNIKLRKLIIKDFKKGVIEINEKNYQIFINNKFSLPNNKFNLDLNHSKIKDISILKDIYILNLSRCYYIVDFSCLSNCHTLDVSNTNIEDVSHLGKVKNLNISDCYKITNIDNLENVIKLNITHCYRIKNIKIFLKFYLKNLKKLK